MDVRRLFAWLRRRLTGEPMLHSTEVGAGSERDVAVAVTPSMAYLGGGWLADAKRLRPPHVPMPPAPAPVAPPEQRAILEVRPTAVTRDERHAQYDTQPLPEVRARTAARDAIPDDAPAVPDGPPREAWERRLVLLRYLVGKRVYNEGFAPDETPDQYRRPIEGHPELPE